MNQYYHRVISLGGDFDISDGLRNIGYTERSYCFDWVVTDIDFVIDCFESQFNIFEDVFEKCENSGSGALKYNNRVYFYKDTVSNDAFEQKYRRRSERLHQFLNETRKHVLFIRKWKNETFDDVMRLKNVLIEKYPHLQFKILLMNHVQQSDDNVDDHIIHKYCSENCFLTYDATNDRHKYADRQQAYDYTSRELKHVRSETFLQPRNFIFRRVLKFQGGANDPFAWADLHRFPIISRLHA